MFKNRTDAGKKLAVAIKKYKDHNVLVLAIPRGGVEVGYQVAEYLNADFSILISRKLPLSSLTPLSKRVGITRTFSKFAH